MGVIGALTLVIGLLLPRRVTWGPLLVASVAVLSLLAAPATWAAYSVAHGTNATIPTAGPSARTTASSRGAIGGVGVLGGPANPPTLGSGSPTGVSPPGALAQGSGPSGMPGIGAPSSAGRGALGSDGNAGVNAALVRYLEAHQDTSLYLVVTVSSGSASSLIIATGKPVMALGGFSGNDAILTTAQLARLVANGTIHYFLMQFGGMGGKGGNSTLMQWVQTHGTVVPTSQYAASSAATAGSGQAATLYYVSSSAASF